MQSTALTVADYLQQLPPERLPFMEALRDTLTKNWPKGFVEEMNYGMIGYVVPHKIHPDGYHCNPKQALPFINIASQKNFIALYHMGLYASPTLLQWFTDEYPKHSKTKSFGKPTFGVSKSNRVHTLSDGSRINLTESVFADKIKQNTDMLFIQMWNVIKIKH